MERPASPVQTDRSREVENLGKLCWLLTDGGKFALKSTFDSIHSPLRLKDNMQQAYVRSILHRLKDQGVISERQWSTVYPTNKKYSSSQDYDNRMLVILLESVCHISPPYPNGWSMPPQSSDDSLGSNIVRLEQLHQTVASKTGVSTDEFYRLWDEICDVLLRLAGPPAQVKIDRIDGDKLPQEKQNDFIIQIQENWGPEETRLLMKAQLISEKRPKMKRAADYRTGNDGAGLSPEDRVVLMKSHKLLVDNIQADDVIEKLQRGQVLKVADMQEILGFDKNSDRMQLILDKILRTKLPNALKMFIDALKFKDPKIYATLLATRKAVYKEGVRKTVDVAAVCRDALSNVYRSKFHKTFPMPWMGKLNVRFEDFYTHLDIVDAQGVNIAFSDMFPAPPTKDDGQRILMEGVSGCGKSTAMRMLAYKWATDRNAFKHTYSVVLHVDLEFTGDEFFDDVYSSLFPENFKIGRKEFWKFLEENGSDVLLLLDGYDASNVAEPVHDILTGSVLKQCTILVSSRIYPHKDTCFRPDSKMYVLGFDPSGIARNFRNLISLCDNKDRFDYFRALVKEEETELVKFLPVPYFSIMLFAIFDYTPTADISSISTLTTLMELFMSSILLRYCSRHKLEISGTEIPEDVTDTMKQLQALAYESMQANTFCCTEDDISRKTENPMVLELGVLERSTEVLTWRFPCCAVRDFLAAQHLADMTSDDLKTELDTQDILANVNFRQVVQMLCGLYKDHPDSMALNMLFDDITKSNHRHFRGVSLNRRGVGSPTRTTGYFLDFEVSLSSVYECKSRDDITDIVVDSFPRRMVVRREGLYPADVLYGLSHMLLSSKIYISQIDFLLQSVHWRQHKLLSEFAHSIAGSTCVKCIKIQWSSLELLSHFMSQVMDGNSGIQAVYIEDKSGLSLYNATPHTWAELQSACQNMSNVTNFSFLNCKDAAVVNHVIYHIASTIVALDLSGCQINLMSASELSSRLEQFSCLKSLDLRNTKQESADLVAITQGLKLNDTITEFCVANVGMDRSTVTALVEFLKLTPSLECLDLSECNLNTDMCRQLCNAIRNTRSFRKLIMKNVKISMEGKSLLTNGKLGKARVDGLEEEE